MNIRAGPITSVTAAALLCAGSLGVGAAPGAAEEQPATLRILVTNDDGVGAPGIDALVRGLRKIKRVEVTVVAPADNMTGTGDATSPAPPPTTRTTTASGYPAIAVQGYPADTVDLALDGAVPDKPHLVATGVNAGQNLGPTVDVSGTVGAAKEAVRRGIPAVAVSQGSGTSSSDYNFPAGVREAVRWVKQHKAALLKTGARPPKDVASINVPTCLVGNVRGLVEVPAATTGDVARKPNCASKVKHPTDDVVAYANGFAALSPIPAG
ncbi:MAG TPA: 5'/3'-nucleotidase SurE [Acidimicrobiia bacterium]|nr:5'/3'-nucleotidase SurE [Acidimicrobiia bacterium]